MRVWIPAKKYEKQVSMRDYMRPHENIDNKMEGCMIWHSNFINDNRSESEGIAYSIRSINKKNPLVLLDGGYALFDSWKTT